VQQRMPNRMGMNTDHALWPGREWGSKTTRADTANTACMKNCATDPRVASLLPDFARNAHGNLRDQNRLVVVAEVVAMQLHCDLLNSERALL